MASKDPSFMGKTESEENDELEVTYNTPKRDTWCRERGDPMIPPGDCGSNRKVSFGDVLPLKGIYGLCSGGNSKNRITKAAL